MNEINKLPIGFFQDYNPNVKDVRNQLVKNIIKVNQNELSNLEDIFFSDDNIDLINKQIVLTVWKRTNKQYKIDFQSKDKLIIVMRYVYIENAKHLPYNLKGQIHELNCNVVGEVIPSIITNFEQKLGYLRDIEKRGELPPLPKSSTADRTLPTATNRGF
uniref:Minor capsid protein P8 central region domain-containing protein n=1 Tax=viral metagenome TaxID=1070528 RepID=A0A6C0D7V4_9ZZZZ